MSDEERILYHRERLAKEQEERIAAYNDLNSATLRKRLREARAERDRLREELSSLERQLATMRRRLKNIIVVGLDGAHEAKRELRRGKDD